MIAASSGAELVDRPPDLPDRVDRTEVGRQRHDRGIVGGEVDEPGRGPARLAPVDVDRGALRDRREPCGRVTLDVEAVGGLPRAHERLLHRVLGEVATPEHAVRDRVHETAVVAVQGSDRARLATLEGVELGGGHVRER